MNEDIYFYFLQYTDNLTGKQDTLFLYNQIQGTDQFFKDSIVQITQRSIDEFTISEIKQLTYDSYNQLGGHLPDWLKEKFNY